MPTFLFSSYVEIPKSRLIFSSFCLIVFVGLSGCGSPTPLAVYVPMFDKKSNQRNDLIAYFFSPGDSSTGKALGYIDRAVDQLAIGDNTGKINSNRDNVLLANGGIISIEQKSTEFVANYSMQIPGRNPTFGVIGIPSQISDIPSSGSAKYTGAVELQVVDDIVVYDLVGAISFGVDFSNSKLNAAINNLSGVRLDGGGASSVATNILEMSVSNVSVVGTSFSGGRSSITNSSLSRGVSGNEISSFNGGFFGPSIDEIGGTIIIDDSNAGTAFLLQGTFVAD